MAWRRDHHGRIEGLPVVAIFGSSAVAAAERAERAQRLAARDAEWAAQEVPVTVEERDSRRVETRGRRCVGFYASGRI